MKVSNTQYAQTLLELAENKSQEEISVIAEKFALWLKKDGQLKNSKKIMEKFEEIYNKKNGIVSAEIITRYKIQDTRYKQVEDFIKTKYGAKVVELVNNIDEKIKGGIIVKVGDEILDASVEGKLKRLKKELVK